MKTSNAIYLFVLTVLVLWGCEKPDPNLMIQKEINENWTFSQSGKNEWLPAKVPGTVHTDLLDNGKIEDPYYRLNEHNLQWIDKVDWEYKTKFNVEAELLQKDMVELDFKGLDTYADVFVNGENVLSADNMFREWNVNVKEALKEGENELHIVFRSPITEGLKKYDWPGNVRQLENVIQKIVLLSEGEELALGLVKDILDELNISNDPDESDDFFQGSLVEINRKIVQKVLEQEGQNKSKAAKRLNITRATLLSKLT